MRSKALAAVLLALFVVPAPAQYQMALPGYQYEFPRDHFNHPDYKTEWWYYTGNLTASDGHKFGYELTFFRQAVSRAQKNPTDWDVQDLYLAHLALSDLSGGHFYHTERLNRSGPGSRAPACHREKSGTATGRCNGSMETSICKLSPTTSLCISS